MEMGYGSLAESGNPNASSPPPDSLNGLKFGKKLYFEDTGGVVAPVKSVPGSSSSSRSRASGRKVQGGHQQPPRCQVEGCKVDLSDAKTYYSRHKVCGMHSKSSKVIVGGLEQRFCQQCSRFHQLPEFDQGKRSCRRRLAGHNERRRKPPPGSVLLFNYGRHPTIFDNSGRAGGFFMDFSAYPRLTGREAWSTARSSERVPGNQTTATERSIPHFLQNCPQNPPSYPYLQGSAGETGFPSANVSSGEGFTGINVPDSSCALSLLSNQSRGSRNQASGLGVDDFLDAEGAPLALPSAPHGAGANQYASPWNFKGNEANGSSYQICPDLCLSQISQPLSSQLSGELELSQQNKRQYVELEHSRGYDSSTLNMHWSL